MGEFFRVLTDNGQLFVDGFTNTVKLFLIAAVGSLVLGTLLGAMRVSPCRPCGRSVPRTSTWCATPL